MIKAFFTKLFKLHNKRINSMKHSMMVGVRFGMTSAIITTLGLIVGLNSGTGSLLAVIGAIIMIAFADGLSDSLAIHISEESEGKHSEKQVWTSTFYTFGSKFIIGMSFLLIILAIKLPYAIIASVIWGFTLLGIVSYRMAVSQKKKPWKVISEHLTIAILVVTASHFLGLLIAVVFG